MRTFYSPPLFEQCRLQPESREVAVLDALLVRASARGDALQIVDRLGEGRNASEPVDRALAGVVCRKSQPLIACVALHQIAKVARTGSDIRFGIEWIVAAEELAGLGNELHQSLGVLVRHELRAEIRLRLDDSRNQLRGQIVAHRFAVND